jgi:sugar phosphate isomerase/epimerase
MSARWRDEQLAYCSNVHPYESLAEVRRLLEDCVAAVRALRGLRRASAGLWLSQPVAARLALDAAALQAFRAALSRAGIQLLTLNGFPYEAFHATAVKQRVYRPDWSEPARGTYTLILARILAQCLPDAVTVGTISSLPLGFKPDWTPRKHAQALAHLCRLAAELSEIEQSTGKSIRVCLEMEPGCVLESTLEAVALFRDELPAAAARAGVAQKAVNSHLGICYDVCHQAVMFEEPIESLGALHEAGITVGKIQISSALEAADPDWPAVRGALEAFAEPRYLHQVRTRSRDGRVHGRMDLPEAFADASFPPTGPWRVHFHMPVQLRDLPDARLGTTQDEIRKVLAFLATHPTLTPHLEVETYTWQVLPERLRPETPQRLNAALAAELDWLAAEMRAHGLLAA